jgi:hypothetical protein
LGEGLEFGRKLKSYAQETFAHVTLDLEISFQPPYKLLRPPFLSQATMHLYPASPEAANRFLKFVNTSPTPFHAVHNAALRLEKAGFQKVLESKHRPCPSHVLPRQIREKDEWENTLMPGGKYYFTRYAHVSSSA